MAITNAGWFDEVEFVFSPISNKLDLKPLLIPTKKETNEMPYRRYSECSRNPGIKKVIFNPPATIVFWYDDIKTVVKCGENETFDPEKGLAMAIAKRYLQNKGNYYNTFKKWLPKEYKEPEKNIQIIEKTCHTCLHADKKAHEFPCFMCLHTPESQAGYWESKENIFDSGEKTDG